MLNLKNNNMSKFNEFLSNDPKNHTDAYNENAMLNEYFDKIKSHDYSYQFSDDHRWWERGTNSENCIKEMIHALCTIVRVDAEGLLEDSLYEVNEEYVGGLTHKTIRSWFKPYVENVDNIFTKPNF
jgi:hypothetical protein